MGFGRVQGQAILVREGSDQRKGFLRFLHAVAQNDKVVGVSNHRQALRGHQFVERVQIEICQQRADDRALWRSARGGPSPAFRNDFLIEPRLDEIENAAVADARPEPLDQPVVRDRLEIALQIGVHHKAAAGFDEAIDDPQRILGAASRPEAEARRVEPRFQNGLQHEFDRRLGDAVLDRGNPQWPHPAIPFRDLHAQDRRRTVISRPQRSRQLRQILASVRREPFDALPVHARRAAVGFDFRPDRRQRRRS